jgi:hypothetical protein
VGTVGLLALIGFISIIVSAIKISSKKKKSGKKDGSEE